MKLPTRPETFACHPAEVAGDGFFPVHEPHISANEYPHNQMKSIQIGDLKITLPIIQGGMGVGISLSGLASAVANEGGVGVISCAGIGLIYPKFSNDYRTNSIMGLREEIRKARAKTSGVIGVNIMVALSNFADMVRTAIEEKADIIFSGAGLPLDLPSYLGEKSSTKLVPIVSSARAAHIICEKWKTNYNYLPDAIVVEGPKAGGHLGYKNTQIEDDNFSLERLIPEVVATADRFAVQHAHPIPVIAAGGLYTGEDIYRIMSLGAAGVQMGSIFVTTTECDASETFKKTYIEQRGYRDHRESRGHAGPGDRRRIPEESQGRPYASQTLSVPLHQNLRLHQKPLLHHPRAVQRSQRQPLTRLCFRRSQRLPFQENHQRERDDRIAQSRIPGGGRS